MLKPVDILILLKICALEGEQSGQMQIAFELGVSPSTVNEALKRAELARLYSASRRRVNARGLEEVLIHGAKYFFAPKRGDVTRGMPTSWAGPPLVGLLAASDEPPPVWLDPEGTVRGVAFEPLHPSVVKAARRDHKLYELLTLVDVLRDGRARESKLAVTELRSRIHQ